MSGLSRRDVHKDSTRAHIRAVAEMYRDLLAKSNVPCDFEGTIDNLEKRVAELNGQSVEDWRSSNPVNNFQEVG